jgi:RimJ/RimL family protein N-acetyltransferase
MSAPAITVLQPGDEAALEAFLLPRVESSMFLIGNLRASGLGDTGQAYSGTYAAALDDRRITAVVAHYWNGVLVFQAPVHLEAVWRTAVAASQRAVGGLIGPNEQASGVKRALGIDAGTIQLDELEKLYSLQLTDLLVPAVLSSGQVTGRRMEPGDVELLTAWRVAYAIETLSASDGPELRQRSQEGIKRWQREGHGWVLERDGELVAMGGFNTAIEEAVQIGGVYTPPHLRRRGYGRAVVAASLLDARGEGVEKAILFTGVDNIAAQKAYAALGFAHIGDYRMVLLDPPLRL